MHAGGDDRSPLAELSGLMHHLVMQAMHCPLCKGCTVSRTSALNSLQHFYTWLGSRKDIQPVRNLIQMSQSVLLLRPGLTYSYSRKKAGRSKTHLYQTTSVFHQPHRRTQPPSLIRMESDYRPKCCDALQLGRKGRHRSFHLWMHVWETGNTF